MLEPMLGMLDYCPIELPEMVADRPIIPYDTNLPPVSGVPCKQVIEATPEQVRRLCRQDRSQSVSQQPGMSLVPLGPLPAIILVFDPASEVELSPLPVTDDARTRDY